MPASVVLPRVRQHDAGRAELRGAWFRGQKDEARAPRVVRGLPGARHPDGHHAQRRGGDGWRFAPRGGERVVAPQPQTSEHLAAVEIMRLKHIIILQNKIDLVQENAAANQYDAIVKFIKAPSCG